MNARDLKDSIDTLSWDMTVGCGETEVTREMTAELCDRVKAMIGRDLTPEEKRYAERALAQREQEMYAP